MTKVLSYTEEIDSFTVKSIKHNSNGDPCIKIGMPLAHIESGGNYIILLITSKDKLLAIRNAINYALER